ALADKNTTTSIQIGRKYHGPIESFAINHGEKLHVFDGILGPKRHTLILGDPIKYSGILILGSNAVDLPIHNILILRIRNVPDGIIGRDQYAVPRKHKSELHPLEPVSGYYHAVMDFGSGQGPVPVFDRDGDEITGKLPLNNISYFGMLILVIEYRLANRQIFYLLLRP